MDAGRDVEERLWNMKQHLVGKKELQACSKARRSSGWHATTHDAALGSMKNGNAWQGLLQVMQNAVLSVATCHNVLGTPRTSACWMKAVEDTHPRQARHMPAL